MVRPKRLLLVWLLYDAIITVFVVGMRISGDITQIVTVRADTVTEGS